MIKAALIFACLVALLPSVASAQNFPATYQNGNDTIGIEAVGTSEALVTYHNHASMASGPGQSTVSVDVGGVQIIVDVWIVVNGEGQAEVATVTPRGGYIAIPDRLAVEDGSSGTFRVMLPMF